MRAYFSSRGLQRAIALVLFGFIAAGAMAGCARTGEPPKPDPKPTYKGTLTLWAAQGLAGIPVTGPGRSWFEERTAAFMAEHTDISVELRWFETPAALEQALAAGQEAAPDMAFGRMVPEAAPRMADINAVIDKEGLADYYPGALTAFQLKGNRYGLPVLQEVQGLALNEAAFAAAGVKLPEGGKWTHTEFENSLRTLSTSTRFGLGFYQLPGYHEWWPLVSGLVVPEGAPPEALEAVAAGLTQIAGWRKAGLIHPDTGKVGAEAIWKQFAGGDPRIAVMPVSSWAVPSLRSEPYSAVISVAGFPGGLTTGYTYGFTFFQQGDELRLKAATALAQYMAAPDQQVRLARETGLVPASISAGNPYPDDPQMTRMFDLASLQRPLPAGPAWETAEQTFFRPVLLASLGDKDPRAVLADMQLLTYLATAPAKP